MAPLPAAVRCASLDTHFTIGDDTHVMSRLHFQFAASPSAADLSLMASTAASVFSSAGLPDQLKQGNNVTSFVATSLENPTMAQGVNSVQINGSQAGGALLPADACVVVSYAIARRYRGGHPRGYWPFGHTGWMQTPQLWATANLGTFIGEFRTWINGIAGAAYTGGAAQQVSISYYSGSAPHTKPSGRVINVALRRATPLIDPVVTVNARQRIGSQRRRLR